MGSYRLDEEFVIRDVHKKQKKRLTHTSSGCIKEGMKRKIRFQMFLSEEQRKYVEERSAYFGIALVDFIRRLIDADREKNKQ